MTTNIPEHSAQIVRFPTERVRKAAEARRQLAAVDANASQVASAAFDGWYHDAAIQQAADKRKRDH